MAWYTRTAADQIRSLFRFYLAKDRPDAALRLIDAVREAMAAMEAGPPAGRPHPGAWTRLSGRGLRWFRVHRYWFAYSTASGRPVVTNVLYDRADIPRRIAPEGEAVPFPEE
ncbi:type II toxin-antitoxin system RelE/ParE family toxin [Rhodocista pekingensis]|uniref:Type II toxin-antitoxin system RelE/ParE family toxin n=1 Tax=Rhodocista pekingensis TaxID=201185 RepID=A0ABW2KTS6_9PROT